MPIAGPGAPPYARRPMISASSASPTATAPRAAGTAESRVLIAYDDLAAYRRALHVIARVFAELNDGSKVRLMPWRFDAFAHPACRWLAVHDAAAAHILVFSVSACEALEPPALRWIADGCAACRTPDSLLVALLGPPEQPPSSHPMLLDLLQAAARAHGLGFLAPGSFGQPASESAPAQLAGDAA